MTCEKCSGTTITVRYHKTGRECSYGHHGTRSREHLHYTCLLCGYDWTGPILPDQLVSNWSKTFTDKIRGVFKRGSA